LRMSPGDPDVMEVPSRALNAVVQLVGRDAATKLLAFAGGVVLARELSPSVFGLFAVATFAVGIFEILTGEAGMGAAFIRMPRAVTQHELDALFTFQLVVIGILALLLFVAAPGLAALYGMPDLVWVARAMCVRLILMSIRTVPLVVSERRLAYGPVALSDVSGQIAYWVVAVAGATAGLGIWSLVGAIIASAAVGTALLFARTRTLPSLRLDWRPLVGVLGVGLKFQGQTMAYFVKDSLIASLGGLLYGGVAVGYLTWAYQIAGIPLVLAKLVERVSYSALSRLQDDNEAFVRMLESNLRWTCSLCFPAFAVLGGLAPQIVQYVYGPKWSPALPSLYLMTINMVLGVGTGLLMPALYAGGWATAGLRLSVGWTLVIALIALALWIGGLGFAGIAAAYMLGTLLALIAILFELRQRWHLDLVSTSLVPLLTAVVLGIVLYFTAPRFVHGIVQLTVLAVGGALVCLILNLVPDRVLLLTMIRSRSLHLIGRAEPAQKEG
jgi:O-antigen/teichoic acid export membrane protein